MVSQEKNSSAIESLQAVIADNHAHFNDKSFTGKSLEHNGINRACVELLTRLCSQQEGTVFTDKESDVFPIKRGTKQGDPMSSLLFNTVLQFSLEEDLKKWQEKHKGIRLSDK